MSLIDTLIIDLKKDEGTLLYAYTDPRGYITIGTGICIDKRAGCGITEAENYYLLSNRAHQAINDATSLVSNFNSLSEVRQAVLAGMAYNLGKKKMSAFVTFISLVASGDFLGAANDLLGTAAAKENVLRYQRYAEEMKNG